MYVCFLVANGGEQTINVDISENFWIHFCAYQHVNSFYYLVTCQDSTGPKVKYLILIMTRMPDKIQFTHTSINDERKINDFLEELPR